MYSTRFLRASSGEALLTGAADGGAVNAIRSLLPLVDAVTPNLLEASALTNLPCGTAAQMERCAAALRAEAPHIAVVLTGGHLTQPADLLLGAEGAHWFPSSRIETPSTHGTGCAFATALLAGRLQGRQWSEATAAAQQFVRRALQNAVPRGGGAGPMALLPQLGRAPYRL